MTERELVLNIAREMCIDNNKARKTFKTVMNSIRQAVIKDGEVNLGKNIGRLVVRTVAEKKGWNPRKQESMIIPSFKKVQFKQAAAMKRELNG